MTCIRFFTLLAFVITIAACQGSENEKGVHTIDSDQPYAAFLTRLKTAITENGFLISEGTCGKCSIKTIDVAEKDTEIISVYRPDLSLRMMQAGAAAGGDVPLRFYVTRLADGTAQLIYHQPSQALAVFDAPGLIPLAEELDREFAKIADAMN